MLAISFTALVLSVIVLYEVYDMQKEIDRLKEENESLKREKRNGYR